MLMSAAVCPSKSKVELYFKAQNLGVWCDWFFQRSDACWLLFLERLIRWLEDSLSGRLREIGPSIKARRRIIKSQMEKQRICWSSLTRKCWLKMKVFLIEPHKHTLSYGFIPLNLLSLCFKLKEILTNPLPPTTWVSCNLNCSTVHHWNSFFVR